MESQVLLGEKMRGVARLNTILEHLQCLHKLPKCDQPLSILQIGIGFLGKPHGGSRDCMSGWNVLQHESFNIGPKGIEFVLPRLLVASFYKFSYFLTEVDNLLGPAIEVGLILRSDQMLVDSSNDGLEEQTLVVVTVPPIAAC